MRRRVPNAREVLKRPLCPKLMLRWGHCGPFLAILGHFGSFWAIWSHFGSFWAILGHFVLFGHSVGHFWPVWRLCRPKKAQNGPKRAPNGRNGGGVRVGLRRLYAATNPLPMGGYETAQPGTHPTPVWAILGFFWPTEPPNGPKMACIAAK